MVTNRGTMPHGFEIEREDGDDEDKLETRILEPGESVEVELKLSEGVYKLECNVEGHDDMGMEMLLEVSRDAPLEAKPAAASPKSAAVAIEAFAFAPPTITAKVGQEITWENHDPADHTVTGEDGSFDSGTMAKAPRSRRASTAPASIANLQAPPRHEGQGGGQGVSDARAGRTDCRVRPDERRSPTARSRGGNPCFPHEPPSSR